MALLSNACMVYIYEENEYASILFRVYFCFSPKRICMKNIKDVGKKLCKRLLSVCCKCDKSL